MTLLTVDMVDTDAAVLTKGGRVSPAAAHAAVTERGQRGAVRHFHAAGRAAVLAWGQHIHIIFSRY